MEPVVPEGWKGTPAAFAAWVAASDALAVAIDRVSGGDEGARGDVVRLSASVQALGRYFGERAADDGAGSDVS